MTTDYKTIDILKFIFAVVVIGIHTQPFSFNFILDSVFSTINRVAVPFFMISSSYFLFSNSGSFTFDKKRIMNYFRRVFILYIVWSIIYLPFYIIEKLEMNYGITLIAKDYFIKFIWTGSYEHLWFLPGILWGTLVFIFFFKLMKKTNRVLFISIFVYVFGTLLSTYEPLTGNIITPNFEKIITTLGTRNGLFFAFPMIALGAYIADIKTSKSSNKLGVLFVGIVVSILILAIEGYVMVIHFKTNSTILWFSLLPYVYFLFQFSLTYQKINLGNQIMIFFRKSSILMYTSHYLFIIFFNTFFIRLSIKTQFFNLILFVSVFISTLLFSLLVLKLKNNIRFLKHLY